VCFACVSLSLFDFSLFVIDFNTLDGPIMGLPSNAAVKIVLTSSFRLTSFQRAAIVIALSARKLLIARSPSQPIDATSTHLFVFVDFCRLCSIEQLLREVARCERALVNSVGVATGSTPPLDTLPPMIVHCRSLFFSVCVASISHFFFFFKKNNFNAVGKNRTLHISAGVGRSGTFVCVHSRNRQRKKKKSRRAHVVGSPKRKTKVILESFVDKLLRGEQFSFNLIQVCVDLVENVILSFGLNKKTKKQQKKKQKTTKGGCKIKRAATRNGPNSRSSASLFFSHSPNILLFLKKNTHTNSLHFVIECCW
jgi:hypothetical protein